jgi:hypothetical protein
MAFERRLGEERLIVAVNPGTDLMTLEIALPGVDAGRLEPVELEGPETWSATGDGPSRGAGIGIEDGRARLELAPRTGRVVRVRSA